ncbi:metal ABC transporter solute-binding protein, Zn/Mn family [Photobacterium rosenbergii]|uniref:metal ABC transporter solute-binding protein, Zn/Mn family n=1 Tax=Photobacterium rosenbergii TaxID=294936 RepID=UPI001C99F695|nr:zinc ABC transporter substrate-binding protein [Photobacterium rosenbergii]
MNKKAMKVIRVLGVCSVMLTATIVEAKDILTATPVTYMVSSELTKGTGLSTQYLPPKRYGMMRLPNWFTSKGAESTAELAAEATAVVTIGAVWPQDPLYVHARKGNIRIVEIDASQSISPRAQGVAALRLDNGKISPFTWLNPTNLTRMAAIVSQDLQQLWPEHATKIAENQQQLMVAIRALTNKQQASLFEAEVDSVILMSQELEDFAAGNQLFVVGRYTKPELDWSQQDKQNLFATLKAEPNVWILTTRKLSKSLQEQLPNPNRVMIIDPIDRWGKNGIDSSDPLSRWEIKI